MSQMKSFLEGLNTASYGTARVDLMRPVLRWQQSDYSHSILTRTPREHELQETAPAVGQQPPQLGSNHHPVEDLRGVQYPRVQPPLSQQ